MPRREAVVEVVLTDGRTLNDRAGTVRGTVENPMSWEEIAAKGARPHRAGAGRGEVAEADRYGICAGTREGHLGPSPADPEGLKKGDEMKRRRIYVPAGLAAMLIGGWFCCAPRRRMISRSTEDRAGQDEADSGEHVRASHRRESAARAGTAEAQPPARRDSGAHRLDSEQTISATGQVVRTHRRAGEVNWAEPTVHETRNVGSTNQNVIRIELK